MKREGNYRESGTPFSDERRKGRNVAMRRVGDIGQAAQYLKRWRVSRAVPNYIRANQARGRSRNSGYASSGELKGMDTDLGVLLATLVSTTTSNTDIIVLNLIQQGAGSWNRVGRKSHLKSVRITGSASLTSTEVGTATGNSIMRMILVWDKQPSGGTIPTFDAIFGTTDQTGTEASGLLAPLRFDNMDRFRVIRDCRYTPPGFPLPTNAATAVSSTSTIQIEEFVKLPNLESVYSGQSNPMTIADVSTGALYAIFRATAGSGSSWNFADDQLHARIRYTD